MLDPAFDRVEFVDLRSKCDDGTPGVGLGLAYLFKSPAGLPIMKLLYTGVYPEEVPGIE